MSVEEAETEDVVAQEGPEGFEDYGSHGGVFAGLKGLGGGKLVVGGLSTCEVVDGVVGVVEEVAFEGDGVEVWGEDELFVYGAGPLGLPCRPEAGLGVGVPSAVVDPVAAEVGEAVETVGCGGVESALFEGGEGGAQGGREGFVGINAECPGVCGEGVGVVFLCRVAFPGVINETDMMSKADVAGGVGGAGVDDNYFIGNVF